MLRLCIAILLSLSFAVPGVAVSAPGHFAHESSTGTEHSDALHNEDAACETGDCALNYHGMVCCMVIMGHCGSVGLSVQQDFSPGCFGFGRMAFITPECLNLAGNGFEADPPPPRV